MKKTFVGTTVERFRGESPDYFKTLIKWGVSIAAVSGILEAVPQETLDILPAGVPEIIKQISGYCALAGVITAIISALTVKSGHNAAQ